MNLKPYKKLCSIVLIFVLSFSPVLATEKKVFENQSDKKKASYMGPDSSKAWNYLERAKRAFDAGDLSHCVVFANKASDINANYFHDLRNKILNALKRQSVKKVGDKITDVYNKLYDDGDFATCKVFDEIFLHYGVKYFSNSIKNLIGFLNTRAEAIPESAYLLGKAFQAQGEFNQAKNYYNLAWERRSFLDNPEEDVDILYSLAETSELLGETKSSEKFLLAILATDELYANKDKASSQLSSMIRSLKSNKNTKKFFLLYRHNGSRSLQAFQKLTKLYLDSADYERALEVSAAAVCIITSELEHYVKMKHFLYDYNGLADLILKSENDIEIMDWANERKFWQSYIQFADILCTVNLLSQAEDLYENLASSVPDYYITQNALYAIQKIRTNRAEAKTIKAKKDENKK